MNGGMYIVSKNHRDIFQKVNDKLWQGLGFDSSHISYQIANLKLDALDMGYKYNHMSMFSESWHGNKDRFDSYIIHYAGGAKFPPTRKPKKGQEYNDFIKNDIIKIYGKLW